MTYSKKVERMAAEHNVTIEEKGMVHSGHYQITGKLMVNYYPNSAKKTAYVAGTVGGKKSCDWLEAIKMANTEPKLQNKNKKNKRSSGSRSKRAALIKRGVNTCHWCDAPLTLDSSTIEHVIPLALGGLDNANNRKLACKSCNESRGSTMPELKKEGEK